ncbi:unnamed protein product [Linum tenue]|uniref:Hcy-binding domain-containing protein n=1 Tax=Linum tenue TaxID=586396 RepID=A0AAV0LIK9_9ROSI|nr:unnamed protein product [Linum tenue]
MGHSGHPSPLMTDLLRHSGGVAIIDGGLATELERHGADLNDPLWSAKCLLTSPHLIHTVHTDYLEAGADIIITASYQATIQGFEAKGYTTESSGKVLKQRPIIVAASVGSYGAYLADGSEYSGIYGEAVNLETLKEFHRRRVKILAESGADLIAFETIPNKVEAQAYVELLEEENIEVPAWFAFNSKDGINVVSGDSLIECATIADRSKRVVAVGINCTPPRFIHELISSIRKVTTKPILIYPNSGECYDAEIKEWVHNTGVSDDDFVSYVNKWCDAGACLVGGCCRTTPNTIRAIYKTLANRSTDAPM